MMPVPERIKVGPIHYTVAATGQAIARSRYDSNMPGRVGEVDFKPQRITLDPELGPDYLRETLLHEVLHAILDVTGVRSAKLTTEDACTRLSPLLLDVLRSNPHLVAFLVEQP